MPRRRARACSRASATTCSLVPTCRSPRSTTPSPGCSAAVALGGSPAQAASSIPNRIVRARGVFALTEPEHGSDIARGLATTARRDGDAWIIDGGKKWIGGAASSDVLAVFARDVEDGAVKAFLVPTDAAGVTIETIHGKVSLRPMQNALIRLDGVRVAGSPRLQRVEGWRDVVEDPARHALGRRVDRGGLQAGALEAACATSASDTSSAGRWAASSSCRSESPGCSATSRPRSGWWSSCR